MTITHNNRKLVLNQDYTLVYKNNIKAGIASITIKGKGNYSGIQTATFNIEKKDLSSNDIIIDDLALASNGKVQKKAPVAIYRGKKLKVGRDYTVSYGNGEFKERGTYTVTLNGKGNFKGVAAGKVVILDKSRIINNAKVSLRQSKYDYTGHEIKPEVTVTLKGLKLTENKDYTVSYANNILSGKGSVIIRGEGEYAGTKKVQFTIKKQIINLTEDMMSIPSSVEYQKGGCTPEPIIMANGVTLTKNKDYIVHYKRNKKVGNALIMIKGKGIYRGNITKTFMITQKDISKVSMWVPDVVYTTKMKAGKYISKPILIDTNGNVLDKADYADVVYKCGEETLNKKSRPETGATISVTLTGKGNYKGTASAEYKLKNAISFSKVKIMITEQIYNGRNVTLDSSDVKAVMARRNLVYGKDYEIIASSYRNNAKKGTAQVTIRGKGDYVGEKTVKFKITTRKIDTR